MMCLFVGGSYDQEYIEVPMQNDPVAGEVLPQTIQKMAALEMHEIAPGSRTVNSALEYEVYKLSYEDGPSGQGRPVYRFVA